MTSSSSSTSSLSEILERFERRAGSKSSEVLNERALRYATRVLVEECVEFQNKKQRQRQQQETLFENSREQRAVLRRCFLHESRVVVDEISRRVRYLVEGNVVEKEIVLGELLAALEGNSDGTKGRFLVRGIYDICVLSGCSKGDGEETYMPLYRAMKSGGANVFSTVLYYATSKEEDIERFEGFFYRTILERNVSGAVATTSMSSSLSMSSISGLARVALIREGSFLALEILTKCLPWYKCSNAEDVAWVSESIADIADWCETKAHDGKDLELVDAIIERASWGAMAQLYDAVKKGEDVVNLSLHTHRILRVSRGKKTNALAACDLISNCVEKLSIEDQSSIFALAQTCVRSYPDILRMHLLELSATLSENHLGGGEAAYSAAEQGFSSSVSAADDISTTMSSYPLSGSSVLFALCRAIESNQTMTLEAKESIFEHALRENDENDDLFTLACMFSPLSLRVRNAAFASISLRFRKRQKLAISGLPVVSLALASIENNALSPSPEDVALATLSGLKATASSASHPLSASAALRTLLPIVEHVDDDKNDDEERSLALELVLLAEAWISAPSSSGTQLSFRFQQAIERAIASHIYEETLAGAKAMLDVSKAEPFRAAETFANAIQTCIERNRPSVCRAIGLETIEVLFEAEALDFYPAFKTVTKEMPTRPKDSNLVAMRWLRLLKYGVEDADVVPEAGSLVVNALIDCALDESKTTEVSLKIEAWDSLDKFNIKQVKNLLNVYDGEDDNEESKSSFVAFTRLVNAFLDEENEDVVRAASKVIAQIIELESESVSRRTRASQKQQSSLIGGSCISQDEEKVLMEISDPLLYRVAIGTAKRLRKSTKQKDDELISPLLLLLLFDGNSYETCFRDFARRNKFSHAWWNEYITENTMTQFLERWMVALRSADAHGNNDILNHGFFTRITGESQQSPDAIQTIRIGTKIVNGFRSDAVSAGAREEIGFLVAKCLRLGCSKRIFQHVPHDEENISRGAFFNDFNELLPQNIFVQLAALIEAVEDDDLALKVFTNSIEYLEEEDKTKDETSWCCAILCALPLLARVLKERMSENNTLLLRAVKATLRIVLFEEEQASATASLGALASLALERGIPLENATCEKIVTVLISTAMRRQLCFEDRCSAILGASALLAGSSSSWCWLPSPPKRSTICTSSSSSSLVDDASYFVRPLLFGRGQDLAKKLLKALESISSSTTGSSPKSCRISDITSLALGFASISARTLILSARDVSKQQKNGGVDGKDLGACSSKLLDALFAVDAEFRKKKNALEALAVLGANIPLPNGDGPYLSLLRRYYGEEKLRNSVVRFASSRSTKHVGGEIVNRVIADYKDVGNVDINDVSILSAIQAAAKSEDADLLYAALALHDQKCENDSDATRVLKYMWLGSLQIDVATSSFAETLLIELLRRTRLEKESLKYATEGLRNMARRMDKDAMVKFSTTLRQGCDDDVLTVLASRLILLGVDVVRPDDLVLPIARWNTKRLRRDELLHFALDVHEEKDFFEIQKLGARRMKGIFEFKKRLIEDACHLIKRMNEDLTRSGECDACSCLMFLCLRFGRETNRGFIYSQLVSSSWDFRKKFFPFAVCSALEDEEEKRKDKARLFDAKAIVESLVVPSASGENPTCARALRELMGKFKMKISLDSYESCARLNF